MTARDENASARIVFFGTGDFAVPIMERLAAGPWRPDLVVTAPDAAAGRGMPMQMPPVKAAAERLAIAVIQPQRLSPPPVELVRPAELFVVAAYGKILPAELLAIPRRGSLVVHQSILPRWRGPSPVQATILAADTETGVTIILADEQADHGPILAAARLPLASQVWTTPGLTAKLAAVGADLLIATLPAWLDGRVPLRPQDESAATFSRILKKEDGHIDWSEPAAAIERMVRAYAPWPGTYAFWRTDGRRVRLVIEAVRVEAGAADNAAPGYAAMAPDGTLLVGTGSIPLAVLRLKPEGGITVSGSDFIRGHRAIVGSILNGLP